VITEFEHQNSSGESITALAIDPVTPVILYAGQMATACSIVDPFVKTTN